jgi:uncharacterized protein YcnI
MLNSKTKHKEVGLTGLTGGYQYRLSGEEHRSDRCATKYSRDFEAEDTRQDRKACVKAKQVCGRWASVRWINDNDF